MDEFDGVYSNPPGLSDEESPVEIRPAARRNRLAHIGFESQLLSQEETTRLFVAIDELRDRLIPLLCLFPSALAGLRALHNDEDYLSRVITHKKTANADENAADNEDCDEDGEEGQNDEAAAVKKAKPRKTKSPHAKNRPDTDRTRALIAAQAAALLSLHDAAAPAAILDAARQELSGLLKLQPPRDACLMRLIDDATQDARRAPELFGDAHARSRKLCRAIVATKDKIRRHNMRLVVLYSHKRKHSGIPFDTLATEGAIGLLRAIESFDHSKGVIFAGYASFWVSEMLDQCIAREIGLVLPPKRTA